MKWPRVQEQIEGFINSTQRNAWVPRPWGKVYIRNAKRVVGEYDINNPRITETLDIATVEVEENYRGKGCFTRWLNQVEIAARRLGKVIYIENVLEERFRNFFIKRGYTPENRSADFCFIRPLEISFQQQVANEAAFIQKLAKLNE